MAIFHPSLGMGEIHPVVHSARRISEHIPRHVSAVSGRAERASLLRAGIPTVRPGITSGWCASLERFRPFK
uniref:Uncharacterized protein n=1 Tax=Anopheles minimus TaxID=112268 RepID=A0A182VWN6_9DIPT